MAGPKPKPKPKPKPIKVSYTVDLPPDPTNDVFNLGGEADPVNGICGLSTAAEHRREVVIPAAGTLLVALDSTNPLPASPPAGMDWDLYTLDAAGDTLSSSAGATAREQTIDKFKKKTKVTILVCNLNGNTKATVNYTFTYA